MRDLLWRTVFRLGFPLARLWWFLTRPEHHGAVVAVWHGGRILAVRQSYRPGMTWPGGGLKPGENERDAARRELAEELDIRVDPGRLHLVQRLTLTLDFRRDHVRVFELHLDEAPALAIDRREIVEAAFVSPDALLAERVPAFVRIYLEGRQLEGPGDVEPGPGGTMASTCAHAARSRGQSRSSSRR